jgi:16S rRNA (cytosine967-C5)-methyltransferase
LISPARLLAFSVLSRVEDGGYASDRLALESRELDSRDAGLASEIVLGALRRQAQLDYLIEEFAGKRVERLDAAVRVALRMGAYQLRHLDRVPAHAVVSESVELVKRARKASAAGMVNAILRRLPQGEVAWPSREVELSMPAWLLDRWDAQFGAETAQAIASAFLLAPETYVRNPPADARLELEATDVPGAFRVVSGDARGLRVQDIGSQSIVPLLDLRRGMTFLDLCAAPGNKTAQALESGVNAIACDRHLHRLRIVTGCARVVLDATGPLPFRGKFDRILIDAPCSGTGTLGRNPEIRWRLRPADIEELHGKQAAIVERGLEHLAPGGRLVYSTCSLERRENEDVVARTGDVRVIEMRRRTPGVDPGDGFFAAALETTKLS